MIRIEIEASNSPEKELLVSIQLLKREGYSLTFITNSHKNGPLQNNGMNFYAWKTSQ